MNNTRIFAVGSLLFCGAAVQAATVDCLGGRLTENRTGDLLHVVIDTTSIFDHQKVTVFKTDATDLTREKIAEGFIAGRLAPAVSNKATLKFQNGDQFEGTIKRGRGAFLGALALAGRLEDGTEYVAQFAGCGDLAEMPWQKMICYRWANVRENGWTKGSALYVDRTATGFKAKIESDYVDTTVSGGSDERKVLELPSLSCSLAGTDPNAVKCEDFHGGTRDRLSIAADAAVVPTYATNIVSSQLSSLSVLDFHKLGLDPVLAPGQTKTDTGTLNFIPTELNDQQWRSCQRY